MKKPYQHLTNKLPQQKIYPLLTNDLTTFSLNLKNKIFLKT